MNDDEKRVAKILLTHIEKASNHDDRTNAIDDYEAFIAVVKQRKELDTQILSSK